MAAGRWHPIGPRIARRPSVGWTISRGQTLATSSQSQGWTQNSRNHRRASFLLLPPLPPRPLFPLSFLSLSLSFPHTILTPTSPFPPSPSSSPFLLLLIYPSSLFLFPGRGLGGHSSHWRFRRYRSSQIRVKPFNFSLPTPFTPPCPHFPPHSLEDSRGSRNLSLIR